MADLRSKLIAGISELQSFVRFYIDLHCFYDCFTTVLQLFCDYITTAELRLIWVYFYEQVNDVQWHPVRVISKERHRGNVILRRKLTCVSVAVSLY